MRAMAGGESVPKGRKMDKHATATALVMIDSKMRNKKRVLVVDDEPGILNFIRASLTLAGYEVTITTDGEEGLQLAQSGKPDIVLLDVVMVPLSGFDVLKKLRAFSQVPVIIFTARGHIFDLALEMGADDFIAKPFRPDELKQKIEDILISGDTEREESQL